MNVYLNLNYLRLFSVPTSYISEYSGRGHGNNNLLENVFSYKYTVTWFTKIDTSNVNITITFKKNLFIKEMIYYQKYDISSGSDGVLFPKEIKIY